MWGGLSSAGTMIVYVIGATGTSFRFAHLACEEARGFLRGASSIDPNACRGAQNPLRRAPPQSRFGRGRRGARGMPGRE